MAKTTRPPLSHEGDRPTVGVARPLEVANRPEHPFLAKEPPSISSSSSFNIFLLKIKIKIKIMAKTTFWAKWVL
jgi:hypothetical protein